MGRASGHAHFVQKENLPEVRYADSGGANGSAGWSEAWKEKDQKMGARNLEKTQVSGAACTLPVLRHWLGLQAEVGTLVGPGVQCVLSRSQSRSTALLGETCAGVYL